MNNNIIIKNAFGLYLFNEDDCERKYLLMSRSHWNRNGSNEWYFFNGYSNDSWRLYLYARAAGSGGLINFLLHDYRRE